MKRFYLLLQLVTQKALRTGKNAFATKESSLLANGDLGSGLKNFLKSAGMWFHQSTSAITHFNSNIKFMSPSFTRLNPGNSKAAAFFSKAAVLLLISFFTSSAVFATYGKVGDFVWKDIDKDGIQDAGEPGIAGVKVTITYPNGTTKATTTTNSSGYYSFSSLVAGNYVIVFTTPSGYTPSPADRGTDQTKDSDPVNGKVAVTVYANEYNPCIDAGFYPSTVVTNDNSVGNFVWKDLDCDGIQDAGEPGIGGVVVKLTFPDGVTTRTTTTNSTGNYIFENLAPGNYVISFTTPAGYTPAPANKGTDYTRDSDPVGGKLTITVYKGEDNPCIDAGFCVISNYNNSVGNFVWRDLDCDGIQDAGEPGIPGVQVTLTYPNGTTATTITNSSGNYSFTNLAPGSYVITFATPAGYTPAPADRGTDATKDSDAVGGKVTVKVYANEDNPCIDAGFCGPTNTGKIGDFVWRDLDCDGIQDAGEPGISGATVKLTLPNGTTTVTTTTNPSGFYQFTGLAAGNYVVTFTTPAGYIPTLSNVGTDNAKDSDPVNTRVSLTLGAGENNTSIDAGYCGPNNYNNSVGDFVWRDLDCDGIQDAGEPGIPGVKVTIVYPNGTTKDTAITDANGKYEFTNLPPGKYTFTFHTPDGYTPAPANRGTDPTKDSDPVNGSVVVDVYAHEDNPCIDAGFCGPVKNSAIGNFVWNDLNRNGIQDAGEPGFPGVVVRLTNANNVTVTTTTNASGFYQFTNLPAGTYNVCFVTPVPTAYMPSPANQGTDDTRDSDPVGGCVTVVLGHGETNNTIDAGYYDDIDDDDDGITDLDESGGIDPLKDCDNDGIPNYKDMTPGCPGLTWTDCPPMGGSADGINDFFDFDRDGVINALDLDSDNDGILDAWETRDPRMVDSDRDGIVDGDDVDGDGLLSSADGTPNVYGGPGLTPQDLDRDGLPNFLDLDSDGDGLTDLTEATGVYDADGIVNGPDTDGDGVRDAADGVVGPGANGVGLLDSDHDGYPNPYDIDSDNDGITDNVEGQPTCSERQPTGQDTDRDGLDNAYDLTNDVCVPRGGGITPYDKDGDGTPDIYDLDTDNDLAPDVNEGSGIPGNFVTQTGDADGDGLIDQFDIFNIKTATSIYHHNVAHSEMGPNGNFDGPVPAGSNARLPKMQEGGCPQGVDRDWRNVHLLPVTLISFTGALDNSNVKLTWVVANEVNMENYIVERSIDGTNYQAVGTVKAAGNTANTTYSLSDNVAGLTATTVYYRLVQAEVGGRSKLSNVITFKLTNSVVNRLSVHPNPAQSYLVVKVNAAKDGNAIIRVMDIAGRIVRQQNNRVATGTNAITFNNINNIAAGTYNLQVMLNGEVMNQRLVITK